MHESARQFFAELGRKISARSRDEGFLFQRISVLFFRFNSVLLHDSFSCVLDGLTFKYANDNKTFNCFNTFSY